MRRRSNAPGRAAARRRSLLLLPLLLLAMLVLAACDGASTATDEPSATDDAVPTEMAQESSEAPTDEPGPSDTDEPEPTDTDEPEPTDTDEPEPTDDASAEPTASDGSGSAGACTGTDDNRLFFGKVAAAVDWPVYCPVLPAGWFVESGEYKSAGGGWMEIAYKGPGGARLELGEGFFCSDDDGCVPDGSDSGSAAFGGLEGTLVTGSGDQHAVVVDRGSSPSWVATGSGLDVEQFTGLVADLILVEG